MVRPCAKYARLNCEHRQKFRRQNAVGYFMSACPHTRGAVLIYLLVTSTGRRARVGARLIPQRVLTLHARRANSSRNSVLKTASHRQTTPTARRRRYFLPACPHPACAVYFWAWFYVATSISAIEKRFRNVAKGNISRLRDAQAFHAAVKRPPYFTFARSADISPPGQLAPLVRSDLGLVEA